ncbi:MAG: hypothetical protein Ct9H90mP1_0470 [Methanobacteriota archaeon]|nr:MAG: hypothetical protein Ct9H90mP1_0470 [Euryarchaeota archaeon]
MLPLDILLRSYITKKSGLAIVVLMLVASLPHSHRRLGERNCSDRPIEVVQSGVHNDRMMSMDADSSGNVHVVGAAIRTTSTTRC